MQAVIKSNRFIKVKEALFWEKKDKAVKCLLCPRKCLINRGKVGFCGARKNIDSKLYSLVYAKPISIAIDPIEKKPLFHFYPGSRALSYATVGCNFACKYCQNWEISQAKAEEYEHLREVSAQEMVELALRYGCEGISHTYTEPTIFYEYAFDISKLAKEKGLYSAFVTNGFINEEPLKQISPFLDAANIDLKAFDEEFYEKICGGVELKEVLRSIELYKKLGIWIELTNLIVPTLNDDFDQIREMCKWIKEKCGASTPLHFSRFFPHYKLTDLPPTPIETLEKAWGIAKEEGLRYVYVGNVPAHKGEHTYCWKCDSLLIERWGFEIINYKLGADNRCPSCGAKIEIVGRPCSS